MRAADTAAARRSCKAAHTAARKAGRIAAADTCIEAVRRCTAVARTAA